jgi:dipeptidase E
MKLYLSSYRIPTPSELEKLIGKPLSQTSVALIANAKDYYTERPRSCTVRDFVNYMEDLGLNVDEIDLREFDSADSVKEKLKAYDLIYASGGNTYMLRYEMRRSGFDKVIKELLDNGAVFGGFSAGALVAGLSIAGVEMDDEPEFAADVIKEGLNLVPFVILPHADDPAYKDILLTFRDIHKGKKIIELNDSQAVVFNDTEYVVVEAS